MCVDVAVREEIQLTCVQTADSVEFLGWDVYPSKSTMRTPITFEQGSRYIHVHVHTVDSTLYNYVHAASSVITCEIWISDYTWTIIDTHTLSFEAAENCCKHKSV